MMLKKENLPHLHQFLPTFWCGRFEKMVKKASVSVVFHSFSFIFGWIFPKISLYLFVSFLIASAGFLILLADSLIVSADAIRIFALRKAGLFAFSLLWRVLWCLWEEKSEKYVDGLSPLHLPHEGECSA